MTSTGRPRLLFLCHTLPYPLDGGVWIRSYHTLKALSRAFDITALFFERSGQPEHDAEEAVRKLDELATAQAFRVPQEHAFLRKITDHLRSLLEGRVFTYYKHSNRHFSRTVRTLVRREQFNVVHVDSLDLCAQLPLVEELPVVCVHHNVESQLLRRRAKVEENPMTGWYLRRQAELQEREERRWCGRVALNVTVSEEDRDTLRDIVPEARVAVLPNGVDVDQFRPREADGEGVLFVGGAGWFPNRDGMEYFCRNVLPKIRAHLEKVTVRWVGSADRKERRRFEEDFGIEMTGYVEDVRPHVGRAACLVVPLRVGGGSRLKILEGWAMGKAIVSTSQGCEGLDARDGENLLVRDDPKGFAEAVVSVLRNQELRDRLGQRARRTAVDNYSWKAIGDEMNRTYRRLLAESDASG